MATYDEYYNKLKPDADAQYNNTAAANQAAADKYIADVKAAYDPAIASAKTTADTQTQGLNQQFQKQYDTQAIQELVNKRKLAESMANQGLTDSGLNRTQETALAVTRTNNEGALTQQKNTQARQISQSLDNYLNGVNSTIAQTSANAYANLSEKNQNVYNSIYNALSDNATSLAKADTAAEAARYKAEQEAVVAVYKAQLAAQEKATKSANDTYSRYVKLAQGVKTDTKNVENPDKATFQFIENAMNAGYFTESQAAQMLFDLNVDMSMVDNTGSAENLQTNLDRAYSGRGNASSAAYIRSHS